MVDTSRPPQGTASHTPGPWYVDSERDPNGDAVFIRVGGDGFGYLGEPISAPALAEATNVPWEVRMRANARLIAAAPQLLKALGFLLAITDKHDPQHNDAWEAYVNAGPEDSPMPSDEVRQLAYDAARAAIAKATEPA